MLDINKISETRVKSVITQQEVKLETLWEEKTCVIIFFRRFGCFFCRLSAKEISAIQPILSINNIRFVGVGFDEDGVPEFVKEGYFKGEIFLDPLQMTYKGLDFKRHGVVSLAKSVFTKAAKNAFVKARQEKIQWNNNGDKFQQGGVLVVTSKLQGSQVLLAYKQDNPADYIDNEDILNALGLQEKSPAIGYGYGGNY